MKALTPRFDEVLVFASELHRNQFRKTTATPYVGHLLGVTALVLEHGGSEDEAIAALLHDAVEDQGGASVREEIQSVTAMSLPKSLTDAPRITVIAP